MRTRKTTTGERQPRIDTRRVETTDYLGMVERIIRAAGRRVAGADEIELAHLLRISAELDAAIQLAVAGQRSRGRSWQDIARATGGTRQAAQQRFGETRRKISA